MSESTPERRHSEAELKAALTPSNIIATARCFFKRFCVVKHVQEHQKPNVPVIEFVQWLGSDDPTVPGMYDVASEAGVPVVVAEYILSQGRKHGGVNQIAQIWPYLVMENRKSDNEVLSIQLIAVIQFVDDTVCPMIQLAHRDTNPEPIHDAEVVQFITSQAPMLAQFIRQHGLNGMHDGQQAMKGLATPDTLAKIMLSAEDAAKNGRITAADMEGIAKTVTYMGSLFPHELPAHIKAQLDAQRAGRSPARQQPKPAAAGWGE